MFSRSYDRSLTLCALQAVAADLHLQTLHSIALQLYQRVANHLPLVFAACLNAVEAKQRRDHDAGIQGKYLTELAGEPVRFVFLRNRGVPDFDSIADPIC